MRKSIAAILVAFALTFGVGMGVASAAPVTTAVVPTTTVLAQVPDPNGAWIFSAGEALAKMFPDGNMGGGTTIQQFGGSSFPSGATYRGFTIAYPNGYSITYRWDSAVNGGTITVTLTS